MLVNNKHMDIDSHFIGNNLHLITNSNAFAILAICQLLFRYSKLTPFSEMPSETFLTFTFYTHIF